VELSEHARATVRGAIINRFAYRMGTLRLGNWEKTLGGGTHVGVNSI